MPSPKFSPNLLKITVHTLIKNEDRWIWYALMSVIKYVDKILIFDTGSTDKTLPIINAIHSPKIILEKKSATSRAELVKLRHEQLHRTTTPWFMLLDGDEIWPEKNLLKLLTTAATAEGHIIALFNRSRNCVSDIYHYLPESKGRYHIQDKSGHLNIRLIRNVQGLQVKGEYPMEAYTLNNSPIQTLSDRLKFVDTWYLHTTHLPRSTQPKTETQVIDRLQKRKFRFGQKMSPPDLPEVFWQPRPKIVPPPLTNRWAELFKSLINY